MATALTVYTITTNDATLATAKDMIANSTGGASGGTATTKVGTAFGSPSYGEVTSQATSTAWPALGSISTPTSKGYILPTSSLNLTGNQIIAGNWTPTFRFLISNGGLTADCIVRAFTFNGVSTYTQIGSNMVMTAQALGAGTTVVWSATSQPAVNFPSGLLLYIDIWLNITANTGDSTTTVRAAQSSSTTLGYTNAQVVTPGYQPIPSATGSSMSLLGVG